MGDVVGNADIRLDTGRIAGNIREAQKALNMQIAADCEPYIPFRQGALRSSQGYPDGIYGGSIEYNTPYAHYIYTGELYLAPDGSSWAKQYEKKSPSGKALTYRHPGTGKEWFEKAKQAHGSDWLGLARRKAGQG